MAAMVVDVFGSRIRIECADDAEPRLRTQWSRCVVDSPVEDETDGTVQHHDGDPTDVDYPLSSAVTLAAITAQRGRTLMLHACGVADPRTGTVAALIAASGTGKTTAARTLSAAGLGYVSDETVAIDPDSGSIRAYPKPLSRVVDPALPYRKEQLSPDELGLAPLPQLPLSRGPFVLLRRDPERSEAPVLEEIDLLDGILEIIPQTSALPSMPQPLALLADTIGAGGGPYVLRYAEIAECVDLVRSTFDRPFESHLYDHFPAPADLALDPGAPRSPDALPEALEPSTRLRRTPYTDAIGVDGRIVALHGSTVSVLDGIGSIVWLHTLTPTTVADLTAQCVAEAGDPPAAADLEATAALELCREGALEIV